jgi:hypothetical protein
MINLKKMSIGKLICHKLMLCYKFCGGGSFSNDKLVSRSFHILKILTKLKGEKENV